MSDHKATDDREFVMRPIGEVRRAEEGNRLQINEPFRPALKQLDKFSHVIVLWWADKCDTEELRAKMQTRPPYASDKVTGIFACRAEYRPNPIMMSVCKLVEVNEETGIVKIAEIDAIDGTPIVDLKAYFPVCERAKDAHIPQWLSDWPEWLPDEGIGLF
ncbi:MAG: tRNA (N6-threonylcarbamoyladenosine(37)-N6)-methyltransferase TrmO [Candidatus Coatesbacteria bacterium]|nr:tRNA (N6-threonylcarbamoyladenosine(37)-N6)-methyltransferase TrmO [Candidatus Coatesbacteria bacterium]